MSEQRSIDDEISGLWSNVMTTAGWLADSQDAPAQGLHLVHEANADRLFALHVLERIEAEHGSPRQRIKAGTALKAAELLMEAGERLEDDWYNRHKERR